MNIDELIWTNDLTWRDILCEIISSMDPWDIDIAELATQYSERIENMREMNFRIPANVVLVSSVLLRMKADVLNPHDEKAAQNNFNDAFNYIFGSDGTSGMGSIIQYVGENGEINLPLSLKPLRVPTRKVTAFELIEAIQDALEEKTAKRMWEQKGENSRMELVINTHFDVRALIEDTYRRVTELLSTREVVLFSELAKTREDVIKVFISLLHLSNKQMLTIKQEKLYDEIYIYNKPFPD